MALQALKEHLLRPRSGRREDAGRDFASVEINCSFYRLPDRLTFDQWGASVPEGFVFAVNASRFITHTKKLKQPRRPLAQLLGNAGFLGLKLGPILFLPPPRWRINLKRLENFGGSKGNCFIVDENTGDGIRRIAVEQID